MPISSAAALTSRHRRLSSATLPRYYVLVPERLITDMGRNLTAIGLYALIARLWRIQAVASWVTLSDNDIRRFDPRLGRSAVRTALDKLIAYGWLQWEDTGYKLRYQPTWGTIRGVIRPWTTTASALGCPAHLATVRVDQRLLDLYMGRLTTHATQPAAIKRCMTTPLLRLTDLGAYARTLAGYPLTTPTLTRLGLVTNGHAVAVPRIHVILAHADTLTRQGLARLGWAPASDPIPPPQVDSRATVFFVDPTMAVTMAVTMTPNMTPDMTMMDNQRQDQFIPDQGDESVQAEGQKTMTWNQSNQSNQSNPPPTPFQGSGGGFHGQKIVKPEQNYQGTPKETRKKMPRRRATPTAEIDIMTKSQHQLLDAGIGPAKARQFRDAPAEAITYALAQAQACTNANDPAAYAVGILTGLQQRQWRLPPDRSAGVDMAAMAQRFGIPTPDLPTTKLEPERDSAPAVPLLMSDSPSAQWLAVQAALATQMTPANYQTSIALVRFVEIRDEVVILVTPTIAVREEIATRWRGGLQRAWADQLGRPVQLQLRLGTAAALPRPAVGDWSPEVLPSPGVAVPAALVVPPPACPLDPPAEPVLALPATLAALLPALQQHLRYRAAQRNVRELALIASAIQAITVERETPEGIIELTPAAQTDLWRPEPGDTVVLAIGQSRHLKDLIEAQREILAEELGVLVDRRLIAADVAVRQQMGSAPQRTKR